MRARSRLISIHDKPMRPRPMRSPLSRNGQGTDTDGGSVMLACFFIVALVGGFLWAYGALKYPSSDIPILSKPAAQQQDVATVQPAPSPNMSSAAVALASSDVPAAYRHPAIAPPPQSVAAASPSRPALKNKTLRPLKPLSREAAQAYAAAPDEVSVAADERRVAAPRFDRFSAFNGF
jgi:hypothetical protein